MIVVPPFPIAPSHLTACNVPEISAGEVVWGGGTTYAVGDTVLYERKKYECIAVHSSALAPPLDSTNWLKIGASNKWEMFDLERNTKTVFSNEITFTLRPGKRINSIFLGGLLATTVNIRQTIGGVDVFNKTYDLGARKTPGWYQYFFGGFPINQANILETQLSPNTGAEIHVTITRTASEVNVGAVIIGTSRDIGIAAYGAKLSATNHSKFERNEFGTAELVKRRTVPRANFELSVEAINVREIELLKQELNSVVAVWSGVNNENEHYYFEPTLLVGVYKSWDAVLAYPTLTKYSLEVEEI